MNGTRRIPQHFEKRKKGFLSDAKAERLAARGWDSRSGGGIRSATFSFGVIQALARNRTLDQIHVPVSYTHLTLPTKRIV